MAKSGNGGSAARRARVPQSAALGNLPDPPKLDLVEARLAPDIFTLARRHGL
jgi:hypothetical protein